MDGVLKSWAVPKGPSLDPTQKRLAMHVEDHPLSYAKFEGIIPKGQYGGGTVMVWDEGSWESIHNPQKSYKEGKLEFYLHGKKLRGKWRLLKMKGELKGKAPWLLMKSQDEFSRNSKTYDVLSEESLSVKTKRSLEEITGELSSPSISNKKDESENTTINNITNQGKILFTDKNISKSDLASYYEKVAPQILPHIINRPLMILRCPQGQGKKCFFQKHYHEKLPQGLYVVEVKEKEQVQPYLYIKDIKGLAALAQLAVIEIHPWRSNIRNIEKPDRIIFDLDPGPTIRWYKMIMAALRLRKCLLKYGLESFVKTSGKKGLHVVVPIVPKQDWDFVKEFSAQIATKMVLDYPKEYVSTMKKSEREGKIFIDYFRNGRGSTTVAPYSCRANAFASVSLPLSWKELEKIKSSEAFDIESVLTKIKRSKTDPWKDFFLLKQKLL